MCVQVCVRVVGVLRVWCRGCLRHDLLILFRKLSTARLSKKCHRYVDGPERVQVRMLPRCESNAIGATWVLKQTRTFSKS